MGNKRKRFVKKDQPNLKRFRSELEQLSSSLDSQSVKSSHDFSSPKRSSKSRKELRKDARKLKKARKNAFHLRKPLPNMADMKEKKTAEVTKKQKNEKIERQKVKKKQIKERQKEKKLEKKKAVEEIRRKQMLEEMRREDKMLNQLEKQLHLKKRKSKNLPQSFISDGLDYLLDVVDADKVKNMYDEDGDSSDLDLGKYSDEDDDTQTPDNKLSSKRKKHSDDVDDHDSDDQEDDSDEDGDDDDDEEDFDSENDLIDSDDEKTKENKIMSDNQMKIDKIQTKKRKLGPEAEDEDVIEQKSILKKRDSKDSSMTKKVKFYDSGESDNEVSFDLDDDEESGLDDDSDNVDDENSNDVDDEDSNDFVDDDEGSDDESGKNDDGDDLTSEETTAFKEDIYGRLRDAQGNIVKNVTSLSTAYVPPGKRLEMAGADEKKKIQLERLRKQLKGLVNRASESNMQAICNQLESVYLVNSRAEVNETLTSIIQDACISPVLTPERLAMELIMMIAILHSNIGTEVGAVFIQNLAHQFESLYKDTSEHFQDKQIDNVVLLLAHLYNFKVIHSILIFDILRKLTASFLEKDIELILLLLKNVGFTLRKDDPNGLKEIILQIQTKANAAHSGQLVDQSRVRFMLDILLAIKNNNMRKIPNYDPEHMEHLKKLSRSYIKGKSLGDGQLRISLDDLLQAEDKGKWWLVGSAWEGGSHIDRQEQSFDKTLVTQAGDVSTKIMDMARKQRMNTEIRKNIFCVIMTSEDFVDAFEKLIRLGLKNQSEREIIHVIMDCCQQEKQFNPFYAYLMQKFCEYDRRFQMTFQFSMWDKFKEMQNISEQNRNNLAKLVIHLLSTKSVSLTLFKVVEFGTLEKAMVRFMKQVLQGILLDFSEEVTESVFVRIAPLTKLHMLQEGLKLFMHHFLLRKKSKEDSDYSKLKDRINLADKSLSSSQSKMLL